MQALHFRDIIDRVMQNNVKEENGFEWQREIRCYYNGNEIVHTKYLTKHIEYGFEMVCPNYNYALATLS